MDICKYSFNTSWHFSYLKFHAFKNRFNIKRWHSFTASPSKFVKKWAGQYCQDIEGVRVVACRQCPSFNNKKQLCSIKFGSPLRKCVVSSIEAHSHDCNNQDVLEIGFGRFKLAKTLIERSGGTWSGVEPKRPQHEIPTIGKGGYGSRRTSRFPIKLSIKFLQFSRLNTGDRKLAADENPQISGNVLQKLPEYQNLEQHFI